MKNYTYLLIDLACFVLPLTVSFYPKHSFFKKWKAFFLANSIVALFFIVWDVLFTKIGVWGFNEDYLMGLKLFNLPLEEILFFICIPYACTFSYFSLKYLKKSPLKRFNKPLKILFVIISLIFIILGNQQLYTFYTGVFTLIFLVISLYKGWDLSLLFLAYFAILPFFLLSNGLLTGSFLESPIVWYNNAENFGIRIFSIPIEDSIYGFLLIALNIVVFEFFNQKMNPNTEKSIFYKQICL